MIFLNAIYVVAGLAWIILIPYNNAPDENTHFHYSVEFIMENHRLPVWGVDDIERFRHALSSYNQMPALNYVVYAIGAAAGEELFGLEPYLGARLVSLGWGLVFLNFLFLAVRELCGSEKKSLIITAAFALIPQVLFSFCYVNGDAHSLAISAVLAFALARFFRAQTMSECRGRARAGPSASEQSPTSGDPTKSNFPDLNIVFVGAAIGLLFSAKYNYFIYLPFIGIFLALAILHRKISQKTAIKFIIASVLLTLLISGFWFIRNWILYGNPLPLLLSEDFFGNISLAREVHPVNRGLNFPSLIWLVQQGFISSTFNSFFAVFGYLNVGFYREIYVILGFIIPLLAALFILGLVSTRDRTALIALAWLLLFIGAVMAMQVWTCLTFDFQPQGRYQFAVLVPIALYSGWAITRHASLKKYIVFLLIVMACLFVGTNFLFARTYGPPVQLSVFWLGPDKSWDIHNDKPAVANPVSAGGFAEARAMAGRLARLHRFAKHCGQAIHSCGNPQGILAKAKRTEKNFYATGNIPLDNESAYLRIDLSGKFLARYRDFKVEFETKDGLITTDWASSPPEHLVNVKFDKKLNAFETCGKNSCFILPLKDKAFGANSVRIGCRIENRRLYDP